MNLTKCRGTENVGSIERVWRLCCDSHSWPCPAGFRFCAMSEVDPETVRDEATSLSGGKGGCTLASVERALGSSLGLPIPCCLTLDSSHVLSGPQFLHL